MPRQDNETYDEYRKRIIDPISKSFCAAKWYNATIWLGSGMTTSCHHPLPHKIDPDLIKTNPKLLHNTPQKKEARRQMQCGERPGECDYCWKVEDINRGNVSDRTFKTVIYDDDDIKTISTMPIDQDVDLKTLEISFDRACNLACSYCNPAFSTTWVRDIKTNGPYTDLVTDGRGHFNHSHDSSQLFKFTEPNPYITAFWEWWPDLSKSLMELRVTGGEPTMSGDFWKLLNWFVENEGSHIRFATNTNLCMKDELLDRLLIAADKINDFQIYTSNESSGQMSEYIRDGLNWDTWVSNFERVAETGKIQLSMMMTINALCLYGLPEFLDQQMIWKQKYGKDYPCFSVNILRFPSFQSALVLPEELRMERKDAIAKWYSANKDSKLLHEFERAQLQRLIDYLDVVKSPHELAADRNLLERDFKRFYEQYDKRRGKNFIETFPALADWYNGIA